MKVEIEIDDWMSEAILREQIKSDYLLMDSNTKQAAIKVLKFYSSVEKYDEFLDELGVI